MARMAMVDVNWINEVACHPFHEKWIMISVPVWYPSLVYMGMGWSSEGEIMTTAVLFPYGLWPSCWMMMPLGEECIPGAVVWVDTSTSSSLWRM